MYWRFRLQYFDCTLSAWHNAKRNGPTFNRTVHDKHWGWCGIYWLSFAVRNLYCCLCAIVLIAMPPFFNAIFHCSAERSVDWIVRFFMMCGGCNTESNFKCNLKRATINWQNVAGAHSSASTFGVINVNLGAFFGLHNFSYEKVFSRRYIWFIRV